MQDLNLDNGGADSAVPATIAPDGELVSEGRFEQVVRAALDEIGGTMLFKMQSGFGVHAEHVAAAAVGNPAERQILLLTLPTGGGALHVEAADASENPVAGIATAYVGLAEAFAAAA